MNLTVRANRRLSADCWQMELDWPDALADPGPGQFVMVRTRALSDPLWRRPFAVHDFRRGGRGSSAYLLYQVVGPTTGDLAARVRGETVDLLGPFGNGFGLEGGEHWLIAGGRGIAPLFYLARLLRERGRAVRVMTGGCSDRHVLMSKELMKMGCRAEVATEDGSVGFRGVATTLLGRGLRRISAGRRSRIVLSACGPEPMLKAVGELAARFGAEARVSLDTLMACGQGYCQGCSVDTRSGYRLCCRDGPVFSSKELRW